MDRRAVAGFLIAPALLPLVLALGFLSLGDFATREFRGLSALVAFVGAFTYVVALLFGPPLLIWFSRRRWFQLWHFALAGAVLGLVPMIVFALWGGISLMLPPVLSAIGAASASVFWLIAIRGNRRIHDA